MTLEVKSKAGARPARGASPQWLSSPFCAPAPFGMTLKERPPRGGAGRALAAVGGRVLRGGGAPSGEGGRVLRGGGAPVGKGGRA